jgi:hypothetical protein
MGNLAWRLAFGKFLKLRSTLTILLELEEAIEVGSFGDWLKSVAGKSNFVLGSVFAGVISML